MEAALPGRRSRNGGVGKGKDDSSISSTPLNKLETGGRKFEE
jgi:hypothetical protein